MVIGNYCVKNTLFGIETKKKLSLKQQLFYMECDQ